MKSDRNPSRLIYLFRHGETEWSRGGWHTGRSDTRLTARGREQALALAPVFRTAKLESILCSPRRCATDTAEIADLHDQFDLCEDLSEWHYGNYEGRTTEQIRRTVPDWTIWTHPCPNGETIAQVAARADSVIGRLARLGGDCAVISHAHLLRVLAARWLGEPPEFGRHFLLDTGSVSLLGFERSQRAVKRWNVLPSSVKTGPIRLPP